MIPLIGEAFAIFAAFCYAFGSVAATRNAQENGGRGNAVLLSIVLTAGFSGGLWLILGPPVSVAGSDLWIGIAWFALAGVLATVLGRVLFFRSIELAGAIETGILRRLMPVFAAVLAILVLDEAITPAIGLAFLLVFSGVALVILASPRRLGSDDDAARRAQKDRRLGRVLAVTGAASYGGSYVTRKFAMGWLPDPLAGAFIGALTGLAWFGAASLVSADYRRQARELFRRPARWQLVAAGSISVGQTAQYVALNFTGVTVVAIIGTIEMFLAAWLAAYVFKTEARPGLAFVVASLLAMAGVVVLSLARAGT